MGRLSRALLVAALCVPTLPAAAAGRVFRIATVAPDGTAWAHEIRAFARDVESATAGEVRVKLYLGGIAGDEVEMEDRLRRGQLDGIISGGGLCERLAPSVRALRVIGMVRGPREALYLINRLQPTLAREAAKNGLVLLGVGLVGMDLLFSRTPVRSLADLRRGTFWIWEVEDVVAAQLAAMGVKLVRAPLSAAAGLYESGRVDGMFTVPGAALAFQWSALTRYATPLAYAALPGCAVLTERAFDELPFETRQAVRAAGAKLQARFDGVTEAQDAALLGGLFARQGLTMTAVSERFRRDFFAAAARAAQQLGERLVPASLVQEATQILAEHRAHPTR